MIRLLVATVLFLGIGAVQQLAAESPEAATLNYKLSEGEEIRYQVEHLANTKTRIKGVDSVSSVRTVSKRVWRVKEVNAEGEMTFEHVIESVSMTQKNGDAEELSWNSESGESPPQPFRAVADQIGKPVATIRINQQGQERERLDDRGTKVDLGMGGITIPMPGQAVKIGGQWSVPRQTRVRDEDGDPKVIKVRELYTLEKVSAGIATLSIRSEPLTPIKSSKVKSQVVQQLSNGTVKFDIDAGRLISRQLDWDETVIGFEGAESSMDYRARLSEKLISESVRTANRK